MKTAYASICPSSNRELWLHERSAGLGASEAAAVLGISPWTTALELWAEKSGLTQPTDENEAMRWGTVLEPHVIKRFAEATGRDVKHHGILLRSIERPWQLATLDGEQAQNGDRKTHGVLEIKCTGQKDRWEQGPPDYVLAQVQHQLSVTEWDWASVAVLFDAREFSWWDVERDEDFIANLNEVEENFWNLVMRGAPPEAGAEDKDVLKALYPREEPGSVILLDDEFIGVTDRFEELKAQKKALDNEMFGLENRLKQAIGEAEAAKLSTGVRYTYKQQSRAEYVVPAQSFRVLRRLKK